MGNTNVPLKEVQLRRNRFGRLGTWYILALSVIATTAIMGQVLIQNHLKHQLNDARVVNVAGRQRMLSQRIAKNALLLLSHQGELHTRSRLDITDELQTSLALLNLSQEGLRQGNDSLSLPGGNSEVITTMFNDLEPHYLQIYRSAAHLVETLHQNPNAGMLALQDDVHNILVHEPAFLKGMNNIVFQFDEEASQKVTTLSKMEYLLIGITILIILLEIFFIFKPTAIQVNRTVNQLISSERNARQLTKEIGALYGSLEKSYEQLSQVNQPVEVPKLYARADRGGNVIFIADLFTSLSGLTKVLTARRLCDLFPGSGLNGDWMDEVIECTADEKTWRGEIHYRGVDEQERWAQITLIPAYPDDAQAEELLVLGADITRQKEAEKNMRDKNRAEVEKKINRQKFRSVLILEGQEEERKRIAMDIHDGIGQMLTSLKFQIEAMDVPENEVLQHKIVEVKQGIKDVIKEVRKVTFNLKPTVLGDYGLPAALNVFVKEIQKLTEIRLTYHAVGNITTRLPQKVENNIFRIAQEAINNAIKYSNASEIIITLNQTENDFIITVKDEGRGFNENLLDAPDVNIESGRGFFNMYERTEYINGHLDIKSVPGKGTTVTLTCPLRQTTFVDI